ncbi:MAG: VOC family protein [Chlamydiae bacterium]|nr:VOC family protein [Chlamydiota bacterium]MBI3267301.1 VOC family protein [Chlamydiota bacterium]
MDAAEKVIQAYIQDYLRKNKSAHIIARVLEKIGIGFRPVADHMTVRTTDVYKRAQEFLKLGFKQDKTVGPKGILEYDDWFAIVLRKPGHPAIFIDQGKKGPAGKTSIIPGWVKKFGDKTLHHVAIQVGDIEKAVRAMKSHGIRFSGKIVGKPGSVLRQIFTEPEKRKNESFSVLELAERHQGYAGFQPPQANSLMQSTKRQS